MDLVKMVLDSYGVDSSELWKFFKPYSKINLNKKRNLKKFKKNPVDYLGRKASGVWVGIMVARYITQQQGKLSYN
jgi:hypothetical protein